MITELIGVLEREKITNEALHHLNRKRVVILRGTTGSGKTALLEHIAIEADKKSTFHPIFIEQCTPYKQFLLDFVFQLYDRECLPPEQQEQEWEELYKSLNRSHSRECCALIIQSFEAFSELIMCVDNIHEATPQGITLFRQLLDHHNPPRLVCSASSIQKLKYLVWQSEILDIVPLSKKAVQSITEAYISKFGLKVEDKKTFIQQIYNISAGNPLAIANKLKYCRFEPVIKKHLLSGHDRSSGRNELDMSFVILIVFVLSMMSRYISRAVGDTHLYMISSIVAALTIGGRFVLTKGAKEEI